MPETAEHILADGHADMVSMARPFLADPEWVNKAKAAKADEINTCIGCNQACLDHVFKQKVASCLVNPRACHETLFKLHTSYKTETNCGYRCWASWLGSSNNCRTKRA
jgi:2,4-dienoyl-CoA reductase (EC 1.3.1.34)